MVWGVYEGVVTGVWCWYEGMRVYLYRAARVRVRVRARMRVIVSCDRSGLRVRWCRTMCVRVGTMRGVSVSTTVNLNPTSIYLPLV